jgi:hypothetical protein
MTSRVHNALLAQLGPSLERLHADLLDMGAGCVDIRALEPAIDSFWRKFADSREAKAPPGADATGPTVASDEDVVLELGADGETSPASLARSLAAYAVRRIVGEWLGALEHIEKSEDRKLLSWAHRRTGLDESDLAFELEPLAFVKALPLARAVVRALRLARQVLDADPGTLGRIVSTITEPQDGMAAFVRDLAAARRSGSRMDQLLKDLWDAAGAEVIDEVVAHREVKDGPHEGVVTYYAGLLKELMALPEKDRRRVMAAIVAK